MKILLAYKSGPAGSGDPYASLLPIGLGSINALLRKGGFPSRVANLSRTSWQETASLLERERPEIIGISQFTHNRFVSLKLAALAKRANPACFVVLGGPHATHRSEQILRQSPHVDAVVLGEGEETFLSLARSLAAKGGEGHQAVNGLALRLGGGVIRTLPRGAIADLDSLPFPASSLEDAIGVDLHRQLEFVITSRGCPASCRFCASPRFWERSIRFRSPRSIVDEIRFIRDRYGLLYFSFRDDTFTADRERVMELCRLLLREKVHILWNCQSRVNAVDEEMLLWMKRAGCECVQYGVESGSRRVLETLGKRITPEQVRRAARATRRAGITLSLYLITGVPGETEDDLRATLTLLDEVRAADGQVSPLAYYPGTALFEEGVASGRVPEDLFEEDRREALYVRDDTFVSRSSDALLERIQSVAARSRFSREEIERQKELLGYCHATNVMAGERYEEMGDFHRAECEYREITAREPENPWVWLLLGELYGNTGRFAEAERAFTRVTRLVPAHAPARAALGELKETLAGKRPSSPFTKGGGKPIPLF